MKAVYIVYGLNRVPPNPSVDSLNPSVTLPGDRAYLEVTKVT